MRGRPPLALLLLLLTLGGCLPRSCHRNEETALFPTDSLSRQVAASVRADTLVPLWEAREGMPEHPRTVQFGSSGRIYLADTREHGLYAADPNSCSLRRLAVDGLQYPYLAGGEGDTLRVFSAGTGEVIRLERERPVRRLPLPAQARTGAALQYVVSWGDGFAVKVVEEDRPTRVLYVDGSGNIRGQQRLTGPYWRHAGMLRLDGDTLVSLTGYRPVVDRLRPGGVPDSLLLAGFDSPVLARSRRFISGEISQAPLLTPSARFAGPFLFVLNLRPGWLRVDVYDRGGRLQHVLLSPRTAYNYNFQPFDLAVALQPDGAYRIAVVSTDPKPRLDLYSWHPDGRVPRNAL